MKMYSFTDVNDASIIGHAFSRCANLAVNRFVYNLHMSEDKTNSGRRQEEEVIPTEN